MYSFKDTTSRIVDIPALPAEAVSINGQYLENIVKGYRTLYTKGRESLAVELNTYTVGVADGEKVKSGRYPARTITVGFQLICDSAEDFRFRFNQLNNILALEEADFVFNDETDKYFSGTPIMNASVEAGTNSVKGEWQIYCAYPFKRSVNVITVSTDDEEGVVVEDTQATFNIHYDGSVPARPVLVAEFAGAVSGGSSSEDGDCGYVAFIDSKENIIQLGNPEVLDLDAISKAETFANKEFINLTGWLTSGGYTWQNRPITGTMTTGNISDAHWNKDQGQTQSYAIPSYGSGSGWQGSTLRMTNEESVNFEVQMVHRLAIANANEEGCFECGARDGEVMVAGFVIDKTGSGTTGTVYYILNNTVVGKDAIDLSYYNTNFGYCDKAPVFVTQTYTEPVTQLVEEYVMVKTPYLNVDGYSGYKTKRQLKKVKTYATQTRQVQNGWDYTQSNLNSSIKKNDNVVSFKVGNLAQRNFNAKSLNQTAVTSLQFYFGGNINTNALHSVCYRRLSGVAFSEQPNVFTAGDIVEADCNSATVLLYRNGTYCGTPAPMYGAFGNDWENFVLETGQNLIRVVWSDWVNTSYKPKISIRYNEVCL